MEELNIKEIQGLKDILKKYHEVMTKEEIESIKETIEYLERSVVDNVIATNIINLLSEILQNSLARSLTKENIEALKNMEVENDWKTYRNIFNW